jgi:N-acetylornithine carbamoyltransferase
MARTNNAIFMHCLPVRRNVIVTDGVIDSPASVVIDEAENRLHVQKAVMTEVQGLGMRFRKARNDKQAQRQRL